MPKTPKTIHPPYPPTPELSKMRAVHDESQAQGAFLDWLQSEKGLTLCRWTTNIDIAPDQYLPQSEPIEKLLAGYHEIDLKKAEDERAAVLQYVRECNAIP